MLPHAFVLGVGGSSKRSGVSSSRLQAVPSPMALPIDTSTVDNNTLDDSENEARPHNVKFSCPLLDYGYPPAVEDLEDAPSSSTKKPILLYLPGFDATYICPFMQFPELGTEFELWCMTVGMDDRSTYQELKAIVLDFVKNTLSVQEAPETSQSAVSMLNNGGNQTLTSNNNNNKTNAGFFSGWFGGGNAPSTTTKAAKGRPIYLVGESFGGILAADVALTLLQERRKNVNYKTKTNVTKTNGTDTNIPVDLQGLTLINPATCFERSQLAVKGPQVAKMPKAMYLMGLSSQLLPLFTDEHSVASLLLILRAKALPSVIDNPQREAFMGRVAISLPTQLKFMPPSTLSWRLEEWLQTGSSLMRKASFQAFPKFRTLIVVGEKDKTLPSIAEAERLANKVMLPSQTQIHVVEGAGHASTCGSRLDLAAVMRKCFKELQSPNQKNQTKKNSEEEPPTAKRTAMKQEAIEGKGPYFGMEERYDRASIGLNPIRYWSKSNFRRVIAKTEERQLTEHTSKQQTSYRRTKYTPK